MIKRALISVSDKTGIVELARELVGLGVEILSTGGTMKALKDAGVAVTSVSDVTGFPECLDGRVKTLHPAIHAGLLAMRSNPEHMKQIADLGIKPIDMVVINLYPFRQTIAKPGVTFEEAIENIDIGGPTMIRAAAKNWQDVAVVVDPADYQTVLEQIKATGEVDRATKLRLCYKVFAHTAQYDSLISNYLYKQLPEAPMFPPTVTLAYEKVQDMRYGENPHQQGAFYRELGATPGCLTDAVQLHGKELSYNNINDTNGALDLLREFDETTVVCCKHANPCGVGVGKTVYDAYMKAYTADPMSVFGGIVVTNATIDQATAEEMHKIFLEIIVAPDFTPEAIKTLTYKKPSLRLLKLDTTHRAYPEGELDMKKVAGGMLMQQVDDKLFKDKTQLIADAKAALTDKVHKEHFKAARKADADAPKAQLEAQIADAVKAEVDATMAKRSANVIEVDGMAWEVVTERKPTEQEIADMRLAWRIVKHTKSNGIAIAKDGQSLGIGPGQTNRIWPTEMAIARSGERVKGAALGSDAFFPFDDCAKAAAAAGITAIIQPGGAGNDQDSIDVCNANGITMVFTGMRHFRH